MTLQVTVQPTEPRHFDGIIELSRQVYTVSPPWTREQLASHHHVFPEGQLVAVDSRGNVVGMAASLIIRWDDYVFDAEWRDFTAGGFFTNHDPLHGRTLYGAEIMADPLQQRSGIGSKLYECRRELAIRLGLRRIRAAARLRGYHRYASTLSATAYVEQVVRGEIKDPTLSFQLKHGFRALGVVKGYLRHDQESLGYAAVIEWKNPEFV